MRRQVILIPGVKSLGPYSVQADGTIILASQAIGPNTLTALGFKLEEVVPDSLEITRGDITSTLSQLGNKPKDSEFWATLCRVVKENKRE